MRIFFDTEFIEDGNTIDLISIGMIKENGEELYMICSEFDESSADDWVKDSVIAKLGSQERYTKLEIKDSILTFIGDDTPEFWAYYADYDWVVFCRLFGRMIDLPKHFPMYCLDLKQEAKMKGFDTHTVEQDNEHNALDDARWNKKLYDAIYNQKIRLR